MSSLPQELCQLCNESQFKYTCPKCNIPYCSVKCYKSSSHLKCSEEFYKSCIQEELTTNANSHSQDDMRKIYEILKRMREVDNGMNPADFDDLRDSDDEPAAEDEDDICEEEDIAERLKNIDINDTDEVWACLSPTERTEFKQLVQSGDIVKLLPEYKPWWTKQSNSKIVELPSKEENSTPPIHSNIPNFSSVSKKSPSHCVYYNIWNILAAYTCTDRFFCGEQLLNAVEATAHLVNLSQTLKYNTNFEDAEEAILSVEMEALTTGNGHTSSTAIILVESREQLQRDTQVLMSSYHFKMAALSDVLKLIQLSQEASRQQKKADEDLQKLFALCAGSVELNKTKLKLLAKKIEYLLSYLQDEHNN